MKKFSLLAAVLLWSAMGHSVACHAAEEELSLAEVLQKSAQAYDALQSYSGTTIVNSETETNAITMKYLKSKSDARIQFVRPGKIHIQGHDTGGRDFAIISDGQKTWWRWELKNDGKFQPAPDMNLPLSAMTGVAQSAATDIATILLKLNWGFPTARMEGSQLQGRETVAGADCYKIVQETPKKTDTYWVDSQTFLLRQHQWQMDEDQASNATQNMPQPPNAGPQIWAPKIKIKAMKSVFRFTIESTHAELDEQLFQNPLAQK